MSADLPFLRSQRRYRLRDDAAPRAALHPHQFHADRRAAGRDRPAEPGAAWEPLARDHLLADLLDRDAARWALTTDAGLGKTRNLAWIERECLARRRWAFRLTVGSLGDPAGLLDALAAQVCPHDAAARPRLVRDLGRARDRGHVVLLLDGLDQAATDPPVAAAARLTDLAGPWRRCPVVLAGRPFALDRHWPRLFAGRPWRFARIGELDEGQQRRLIGDARYEAVPADARAFLATPRVLEFVRGLADADLGRLPAASHVYHAAIRHMLRQAAAARGDAADPGRPYAALRRQLRRPAAAAAVSVVELEDWWALLGALAFAMYARAAGPGAGPPNLDRVAAADMPAFLADVRAMVAAARPGMTSRAAFEAACRTLCGMNAFHSHGWLYVDALGGSHDLLWRNAPLQEFLAAYWATRWGGPAEQTLVRRWVVDLLTDANRGFDWFWRYATEMPAEAITPAAWQATMAPLYAVAGPGDPPPRSTEFVWRSWDRMAGTPARQAFAAEFDAVLGGARGPAEQATADDLLAGFVPLAEPGGMGATDGGTFLMGDGLAADRPVRRVTLTAYRLHRHCVTNAAYELFDPRHAARRWSNEWEGYRPHPDADDRCPVVNVSWYDAAVFARWVGERAAAGRRCAVTLPTEAQWEYAAWAGRLSRVPYSFGPLLPEAATPDVCNFDGTRPSPFDLSVGRAADAVRCRGRTVPVGSLPANHWGLSELHGNVREWCADWYRPDFYTTSDGHGPDPENRRPAWERVVRGGSWHSDVEGCGAAHRESFAPGLHTDLIGFRLAAVPVPP